MDVKPKLVIKRSQINEVVEHLLKTVDDSQLDDLDFEGIENLAIDLTTEFGNEIIQNIVNRKSKKKPPKNIKIINESKKKL